MSDPNSTPSGFSATIESWLASLPEPSRKRKAPVRLESRPAKQRRIPLGISSNNKNAMPNPRTPVNPESPDGRKGKKRATSDSQHDPQKPPPEWQGAAYARTRARQSIKLGKPSFPPPQEDDRAPRLSHSRQLSTMADLGEDADGEIVEGALLAEDAQEEDDGIEDTPRPQRSVGWSSSASRTPSAVSQSSSKQSGRSRASSPVKMTDLRPLQMRLEHLPAPIEIADANELAPLRQLLQSVDDYADCFAFLPGNKKRQLQSSPELHRDYFYDRTLKREKLGSALSNDEVSKIYNATVRGKTKGFSEAEWNNTVHHPILSLALERSSHHLQLEVQTITTARVSRSCLPSTTYTTEAPISGRHVDFVISLKSRDTPLENAYLSLSKDPGSRRRTFNQTDEASVADTPFAVSIETKSFNTIRLEDGRCQLSMWALAQFRKAELLQASIGRVGDEVEYMPLLMLSAAGPDWRLLVAVKDRKSGRTNLYEGSIVASTDSKVGIHRVVATLHALMDWAERVYRPWFLTTVTK